MRLLRSALFALAAMSAACGNSPGADSPNRTPLADKWFARAKQSYHDGDFEDARHSAEAALQASPSDPDIRTLTARIALTRLEFAETLKLTNGLQSTEVHALRGRAHWYAGNIEQAADELEAMLKDPTVKDPWAREVAQLARRGTGRHPFAIEGGLVAAVEMPRAGPALIVPCELEGERILALVSTAVGELIIDSTSRREPAWVNLKFGDRTAKGNTGELEVKDVPALTQDLSGLSRQMGAPIKALLGVNLLRHMHVTFDRRGDQFVVRKNEPSIPPDSSRVPLYYVRGGGMMVRANVSSKDDGATTLLVDSAAVFPLALESVVWKRAGVDPATLQPEPGAPNVRAGVVPSFKIGGFDLPKVPAMEGTALAELRTTVDLDLGGVLGGGLLSVFRVTLGDDGRYMWLEPDPGMAGPPEGPQRGAAPGEAPERPGAGAPTSAPAPAPVKPPPAAPRSTPVPGSKVAPK